MRTPITFEFTSLHDFSRPPQLPPKNFTSYHDHLPGGCHAQHLGDAIEQI